MALFKRFCLIAAVFLSCPQMAMGDDFEDALAAFDHGDYDKAAEQFLALAKSGQEKSEFNLGLMYFRGLGVPQDMGQARYWALKSARQGYAPAQYTIGAMYSRGQGFENNPAEAAKWFGRAAAQGNPQAQHDLASLYGEGRGVPPNAVLSHMLYALAIPKLKGKAGSLARDNQRILAEGMTGEQIALARQMAADWKPK